jgi:hypothetical protein
MAERNVSLDDLRDELNRAHVAGKIAYYHIGKVPSVRSFISEVFYEDDLFDVYIGLSRDFIHKEDKLRKYVRTKYEKIVRVIVVELHP